MDASRINTTWKKCAGCISPWGWVYVAAVAGFIVIGIFFTT